MKIPSSCLEKITNKNRENSHCGAQNSSLWTLFWGREWLFSKIFEKRKSLEKFNEICTLGTKLSKLKTKNFPKFVYNWYFSIMSRYKVLCNVWLICSVFQVWDINDKGEWHCTASWKVCIFVYLFSSINTICYVTVEVVVSLQYLLQVSVLAWMFS